MRTFKSVAFIVCLSIISVVNAQVYKWKDKNGVTQYSDTPPPTVKTEELKSGIPVVKPKVEAKGAESQTNDKAPEKMELDAKKRQRQAELDKIEQENKVAKDQEKAERCKAAQKNFKTYEQGGRIIDVNEKGERNYLSDADIAKGKAEARKIIVENCD